MRRLWLAVAVVVTAACSHFREMFSLHADVAAEAAGQQLKGERLAQIMTHAKALKVNQDAADFVTGLWVDYTLFSQALAARQELADSATVAEAMWPEIAEMRGTRWHDTLMARRSHLTPAGADSLYALDSVRVLQHILFSVQSAAEPPVKAAARKKAEAALARIKAGADFGALAEQFSEDPASRRDRGFLPASPRGKWVTAFDSAGWALPPGGISGIVETPFGYHIIRRPTAEQVRERIMTWMTQKLGVRLDSLYMDSLATVRQLKVSSSAPALVRSALADPDGATASTKTLASYRGGGLTLGEFMRWVNALPMQFQYQLKAADDSTIRQFARIIAQNQLLLAQADSARITLTEPEWKQTEQKFRSDLDTLRAVMGLGDDVSDSTVAPAERVKLAALKLEVYFDQILAGKTQPRPLPAQLASVLRSRGAYRIHPAGIARALKLAEAASKSRVDSLAARAGLQPAPGPAPIPGASPPAAAPAGKPAKP